MRSGFVAVIGRPNVGKSTLINAIVGRKVSIVTRRPQTTRQAVHGVYHGDDLQVVFVDTPGLHRGERHELNRAMNRTARNASGDADLILFLVEAGRTTEADEHAFKQISDRDIPCALVLTKVDQVADKTVLLEQIDKWRARRDFAFIIPLSARQRDQTNALLDEIGQRLEEGPPFYPEDQFSNHGPQFAVAERVRERLMMRLRDELPYSLTVETESMEERDGVMHIDAAIWVAKAGQKQIVIGRGGDVLKAVGSSARRDIERDIGQKVMLKLWVRVREGWIDDASALRHYGLAED